MNEDQARAILGKVQHAWGIPLRYLATTPIQFLLDELDRFPVTDVSEFELEKAIDRMRSDPRWAE